jgi:transcriptional regulator with XRE-family HTH domain
MGRQRPELHGFFPTDKQVRQIVLAMGEEFGGGLFQLTPVGRGALETAFRFSVLARCLKLAREQHGITIATASRALHVPPARLKELEKALPPDAALLLRYLGYLGLEEYYRAWRAENPGLATTFEAEAARAGVIIRSAANPPFKRLSRGALPPFPGFKRSALPARTLPVVEHLESPPTSLAESMPLFASPAFPAPVARVPSRRRKK